MSVKIIFHIGMPKTATTFFQREMFPKLPNVNFIDGHCPSNSSINGSIEDYRTLGDIAGLLKEGKDAKKLLDQYLHPKKLNLYSYESIYGGVWSQDYEKPIRNIRNIMQMYPGSRIILGKRRPDELMGSCYSEYIKRGGSKSMTFYLKKFWHPKTFHPSIYNAVIDIVEDNDGEVFLFDFDDFKQKPDIIIHEMLEFMDLPIVPINTAKRVNVSLSDKEQEHLRKINRFFRTEIDKSGFIPWDWLPPTPFEMPYPPLLLVKIRSKLFDDNNE